MTAKAQVSLELMLVFLVAVSGFLVLSGSIERIGATARHGLAAHEAEHHLNSVSALMERALITGSAEAAIHSSSNYTLSKQSNSLSIHHGDYNTTRSLNFGFEVDGRITRGENIITVEPHGGVAFLRVLQPHS
jgi:hypothetical protein